MLRINNIIPSGATPQPTQPIATIRPLTNTVIPVGASNAGPAVPRPVVQPVRSPMTQAPAVPVATRPISTPVLTGGRAPIPVQIPRTLPPVQPINRVPVQPVAQGTQPVARVVQPIPVTQGTQPVARVVQTIPVAQGTQPVARVVQPIPVTRIPVARPPMSPVTGGGVPRPTVIPAGRGPVSPVIPTGPISPVQRLMATPPRLTIHVPSVANIPVMPPANRVIPSHYTIMIPAPQQVTERPLGSWQLNWFGRIRQILGQNYGYIDTSQPGAGKTSVALWVAKVFNLPVLVVAPAGIVDAGVWRREAQRVNAQHLLIDVISYNSLAGKKFKQPNHPYLTSLDRMTEGGVVQTRFDATQYYKDLTARGCLLVFDEFSNLKNTSRKLKASLEMLANVITEGGPSRYALLSGTPFDKEGHAVNILRALRYIRAPRLYYKDPSTKQVTLEGLQELIEACRLLDAGVTARVLSEYNIDAMSTEISQSLAYDLYTTVIKEAISGSMISPPTEGRYEQYNGFFNINPNDFKQLQRGINDLATALRFDPRTGEIAAAKGAFGRVTPALRIIEFAKIRDMIRFVRQSLQANPRLKVVIGVNYTETIDALMAGLADYGPIQFDGRTKKKQRVLIEDLFRDSPQHRVLVGNIKVIGSGMSFQSFNPDEPRLSVGSPSYHMLDISQFAYRTNRAGKKGDAEVYIFYGRGNGIEMETKIFEAMVRKSGVVKGTLDENGNELKLPGEYQSYYEPVNN